MTSEKDARCAMIFVGGHEILHRFLEIEMAMRGRMTGSQRFEKAVL